MKKLSNKKAFPLESKPFAYLPFVSFEEYEGNLKEYTKQDKFSSDLISGRLEIRLTVISEYLFVGSGLFDFKGDKVYHSFYRLNDKIVIPGSSIKGGVRSFLEAISGSCSAVEKRVKKIKCEFKEPDKLKLCPACRIFGTTGYAGRIRVSDALPVNDLKEGVIVKIGELFQPRINKGMRKFYQQKRFHPFRDDRPERNTRFVEAVKKNEEFMFHIDFSNLREEEISLFLYAMGVYQDYFIKVGGAKPRCFGTVKFIPQTIKLIGQTNLTSGMFEDANLEKTINSWMNNKKLMKEDILNQYKKEIAKEEESCPQRGY